MTGSIVMFTFVSMQALLLSSTLAFLIMRLRRPRPPLRRLIKQPGVVACEVWLLGMFLGICLAPLIEDYPLLSLIVVISTASAIPIAGPSWYCGSNRKRNRAGSTAWAEVGRLLGCNHSAASRVHLLVGLALPPHFQRSFSFTRRRAKSRAKKFARS